MINFIGKSMVLAFGIITCIFTFVPESVFEKIVWISQDFLEKCELLKCLNAKDVNVVLSRLICFFIVWFVALLLYAAFKKIRWWTTIKGQNYSIRIEYGNILEKKNCKRVINFDECFTTQVGNFTADINPSSICGQYLAIHPNLDMQRLIQNSNVAPARKKSKYQQKERYDSGTIVPNGDDLLMSFAKLDEKGKGRFFSRDEYLECLDTLWKELENNYSEKDVCVPILGSGTTSFDGDEGASIPKQCLLDMMFYHIN